ncbi:TPA: hypothetical protein N0F65_007423 [Lagenidium giganteum]|uniref:Uncharacterized protein n=1 Tax=Lagenidium giganteum TaxID=4803 RepID=A0AAV2ZCU5_9STRA|nr:TPA: hypothetical protein N0F65_007423 [Lagenidium giganteum]
MDTRDEEDLTIQIPPNDGSQTERTRGTYGGRQRWISAAANGNSEASSKPTAPNSLLSPRKTKMKVTAPSVHPFLTSMGILVGEETHIVDKEVNEVAILRRDYDNVRNSNWRKEQEIKKLEEEIQNMTQTLNARVLDGTQTKSKATNIENKSGLYESKLEEEVADRGVYNHMIQRLTSEALAAKKLTLEKEKQLQALQHELASNMGTLLAARQEKTTSENLYKKLYEELWEKKQENIRALDDMQQAVEQTKLKYEILEQREISRKKYVQEALGEMKMKESKRLRHESNAQIAHFSEIQEELSDTDWKLLAVETEFKKIVEAAGTNDVDKIIAKFVNREETFRALKEEHTVADARMRKLREKHKQLNETLSNLRGSAVNTRTIYQEMDQTAERLKEIEKDAAALSEKFNRSNVMMDSFRACMLKCLTKLSTVHGSLDYDDHHELSRAMETPTAELLHMVEQKLNRVLDVINREKAERELHRTEASLGGSTHSADGNDKNSFVRQPAPSETEEHFILRMSSANASPGNIRVRPKSRVHEAAKSNFMTLTGQAPPASGRRSVVVNMSDTTSNAGGNDGSDGDDDEGDVADEDTVIDRQMRKKLVGLIVNRGKRGKKNTTQPAH